MKSRRDFFDDKEYMEYLRYYYAGQALPALIDIHRSDKLKIAERAFELADQMIAQSSYKIKEEKK